jgi:DNA-binding NarL/FixJ family response regulator
MAAITVFSPGFSRRAVVTKVRQHSSVDRMLAASLAGTQHLLEAVSEYLPKSWSNPERCQQELASLSSGGRAAEAILARNARDSFQMNGQSCHPALESEPGCEFGAECAQYETGGIADHPIPFSQAEQNCA